MKITLEFDGDTTYAVEGNRKTFHGLATKAAFKRQFGVPLAYLSVYSSIIPDDADEPIDISKLKPEQVSVLPDPDVGFAFLAWLEAKRRDPDVPDGKWDDIVERITDVEIDHGDEPDPTEAATST